LKQSYRRRLTAGLKEFRIAYLNGSFELLSERAAERKHRFMPASLLRSQFEALEPPRGAIEVDVAQPVADCVRRILAALGR
jgi:gluconokinase